MSTKQFERIALMGRPGVPGVKETLIALRDFLPSLQKKVVLAENAATIIPPDHVPIIPNDQLEQHAELLIVVGGDGSLLNAAHTAVMQNLPVLGINRGRLGFLTDIHPSDLSIIKSVLNGHYFQEKRFLLETKVEHHNQTLAKHVALNDVVLLPSNIAQMIEFEIYINRQFVCAHRADGLIVATPTGSTAYALSGGGPILHPGLDAIVLVPMFPHTLSSRPIVVKADSEIAIIIASTIDFFPHVSCDGQKREKVPPSAEIIINKHMKQLTLIHPYDYNYYDTLRKKLDWEKQAKRND